MLVSAIAFAKLICLMIVPAATATRSAGRAPPMGWSSWNAFHSDINETLLLSIAAQQEALGLIAAGYDRFNIDEGYENRTGPNSGPQGDGCAVRGADGNLLPDTTKFPNGLAPLSRAVHKVGMQFGMYLPFFACHGSGSTAFDHPVRDIDYCAGLNASMVKVDAHHFSYSPAVTETTVRVLRDAIDNSSAPGMLFSNCHFGCMAAGDARRGGWAPWCPALTDMWRVSADIDERWTKVLHNLDMMAGLGGQAGPLVGWNDPDILEVGVHLTPGFTPLTETESQSHFALWCVASAPLLIGFDLRAGRHPPWALDIVTNPEAIAVNQGFYSGGSNNTVAGIPIAGDRIWRGGDQNSTEIWAKPMPQEGAFAVVLFNRGEAPAQITLPFALLGAAQETVTVRDLIAHTRIYKGVHREYTATGVAPHGVMFVSVVF